MSVKKGAKFGRRGGSSDGWSGIEEVLVVDMCGRERDAERGRLGGRRREGDVEAGGFGVGEVCEGGSLPGRGGVGIEASADMA
jgi:hypothetical protein